MSVYESKIDRKSEMNSHDGLIVVISEMQGDIDKQKQNYTELKINQRDILNRFIMCDEATSQRITEIANQLDQEKKKTQELNALINSSLTGLQSNLQEITKNVEVSDNTLDEMIPDLDKCEVQIAALAKKLQEEITSKNQRISQLESQLLTQDNRLKTQADSLKQLSKLVLIQQEQLKKLMDSGDIDNELD